MLSGKCVQPLALPQLNWMHRQFLTSMAVKLRWPLTCAPKMAAPTDAVNGKQYCLWWWDSSSGTVFPSGRNPCQANNGGCAQLCLPTSENSRSCACTVGYNLRADRMSCEGRAIYIWTVLLFLPPGPNHRWHGIIRYIEWQSITLSYIYKRSYLLCN